MKRQTLIVFTIAFIFLIPSLSGILVLPETHNLEEHKARRDNIISTSGWLDGYNFRKSHTITGSIGAETDYQILLNVTRATGTDTGNNVFIGTYCQDDFEDLRFTDDDKTTELDYWMERYTTAVYALFWVEVSDDLDTEQMIYMYYGNSSVSTTSDGDDTFLFYEDWDSASLRPDVWDEQFSDGSISYSGGAGPFGDHGRIATISGGAGTAVELIESDLHLSSPFATRFRSNIESTVGVSQRTAQGVGTAWGATEPRSFIYSDAGTENFMVCDNDGNADNQAMTDTYLDAYTVWDIKRDDDTATLWADDVQLEAGDMDPDTETTNVAMIYTRDSEYDVLSDWIIVRKYISSEPVSSSWGEREDEPFPEWHIFTMEDINFYVPINQMNISYLLMLGGLVMIPTSTVLLVKGGRSEMSRDKLFLVLLMFLFGWALFLGGIL